MLLGVLVGVILGGLLGAGTPPKHVEFLTTVFIWFAGWRPNPFCIATLGSQYDIIVKEDSF